MRLRLPTFSLLLQSLAAAAVEVTPPKMPAGRKATGSAAAPARKTAKGYKRPVELSTGIEINSGSSSSSSSHKQVWTVGQLIGHGGFGDVYVTDISRSKLSTSKSQYVVKVEPKDNGPLFVESKFFKSVAAEKQINDFKRQNKLEHVGVPIYYDSGVFEYKAASLRYLVIQRLGSGLDAEMRKMQSGTKNINRLPVPLLFELAVQLVDALHYIHSHGYTHGDIKENNIMLGWPKSDLAYLIDFGLTNRFMLEGTHREYRENPKAAHDGTLEFTSMDSHKGVSGSRRSDMQILGFCLTKLLYGQLPWSGIEQPPVVMEQKSKYLAKPDSLLRDCAGRNNDVEQCKDLENYWKQVTALKYDEEPNYSKLRSLFQPRSSRGLFNVAKNLVLPAASSSSKRRTESPQPAQQDDQTVAKKATRKPAARSRQASVASSSSSKRSKSSSSTKSEDSDDERLMLSKKKNAKNQSTLSTRAARAAKRLKLHSISESGEANDDDDSDYKEDENPAPKSRSSRQAKHSTGSTGSSTATAPRATRANRRRGNSDMPSENDSDAVFEAAQSDDEIEVIPTTAPRTKKAAVTASSSGRRAKDKSVPPVAIQPQRPVLLLPVTVSPKKKCLQYYDAEVYAIPPLPKQQRASSVQPTSEVDKNPFRLNKFKNTGSNVNTQQSLTADSDDADKEGAANLSFSQPATGSNGIARNNVNEPRAVHKKLMHFDHEVTVLVEDESGDAKVGRNKRG